MTHYAKSVLVRAIHESTVSHQSKYDRDLGDVKLEVQALGDAKCMVNLL